MYVLLGASLLAVAVIIERFTFFRKIDVKQTAFLNQFYDLLKGYQIKAAEELCAEKPGPLANMSLAALSAADRPRDEIREILEDAGSKEIPVLEANLGVLATISYISPLLGLLGTVLGLIKAFQDFEKAGMGGALPGAGLFAAGIWEAMLTTAAGLTLGIVTYIISHYFHIKKEKLIIDLESSGHELVEIITENQGPR
ncbi:MAG: MotA/TolQ/ExbB proton channel family protein [Planctomycetes bacterium]|nr:MotA/TolQ/ExbB proton channel family protein [Planctomycetota bacterium]